VTPRIAFDIFAVLFADPAHAADIAIEDGWKFRAAEADDVDVVARRAGDRQDLVDGDVGMLAPVALATRQPLELHRGRELIIVEDRGDRVMASRMRAENEL